MQTDLYDLPLSDFHDITSGNNGFSAGTGYDLVTGIGTPLANLVIPALAGTSINYTVPTSGSPHKLVRASKTQKSIFTTMASWSGSSRSTRFLTS